MANLSDPLQTIEAHSSYVNDLKFSKDGKLLFSAGMDNIIKVWDTNNWNEIYSIEPHNHSVNIIRLLHSNEDIILSGSTDKTVKKSNWKTGEIIQEYSGHKKTIGTLDISKDEKLIAAGSYEGKVLIWDNDSAGMILEIKAFDGNIAGIRFVENYKAIWISGLEGLVKEFNSENGDLINEKEIDSKYVLSFAISSGGPIFATTGGDGTLKLWDANTFKLLQEYTLNQAGLMKISWHPKLDFFSIVLNNTVQLFDFNQQRKIWQVELMPKGVYCTAFHPEESLIAVGTADKKIRVYKIPI